MEVRPLGDPDRDAAVSLWVQAGLTRPWNDPASDFDRALAGPTSAVLGCVEADSVVATVMVGHDGHRGWVYYLAVDATHRGAGLGRRMMEEAEGWLRAQGVPKLNLMVRHDNRDAHAFYQRLGYTVSEVTVLARWLD
jgi:ribosomal protein S18 acetylase RimI-like enzyme